MTSADRAAATYEGLCDNDDPDDTEHSGGTKAECVPCLAAAFEEVRREARVEGLTKAADIVRRRRVTSLAVQGDGSMIRVKPAYLQALDEAEVFILAEAENTLRALQEKPTNG